MGNSSSNVTSGVKKQADNASLPIYKLADLKGDGELVQLLKKAVKGKNDSQLDELIRSRVLPFLYNNGQGKLVPISELVYMRNKDSRPKGKQLQDPTLKGAANDVSNNSGGGNGTNSTANNSTSNSNIKTSTGSGVMKMADLGYSLADINGEIVFNKQDVSKYRECCWDANSRGAVGETILHICLLNGTSIHADLAKRLIRLFPSIINDVYLSDEYYGENVLHMAIVNEDPAMVKFLLDNGVNYHQRCIGSFFSPEDQKMSRSDSLDQEWVYVCVKTNYDGYVYWGEYPLSFAACLGQEECYRLVLAKGADPNLQDTNGNAVLHMVTIFEKIKMFDMAYELGALNNIENMQKLTPLTLAATLAKRDIFMHILKIEREILWQIGDIVCAAYPLARVDTIDINTGQLVPNSAVNLIVYGNNIDHLELLEGVITDLLVVKWNAFLKFRFYQMFGCFFVYFIITFVCFILRPVKEVREVIIQNRIIEETTSIDMNDTYIFDNMSSTSTSPSTLNDCYLLEYDDAYDVVRWVAEGLTLCGAVMYLSGAGLEIKYLGYKMFTQNLMTVPSRVLFLFSCCLITLMTPLRFTCNYDAEDKVAVLSMLTTAPYFLFFCRGFKMVGPFVVMIYRMIQGDLLRFVVIYLVFVLGFSQAYYIIFQSHDDEKGPNYFEDPVQSILAMFIMSLQEFGDIYNEFDNTQLPVLAKFMFMLYMGLVAILLVNMLIAMFGMTYQIIAETRNEWQRQWARIVLVVERGISPQERLRQQKRYSQPLADGRPALVLKHQMTEEDFEEMKDIREMKSTHIKNVKRREKGKNVISSAPGSPQKRGSQLDIMAPLGM